MVHLEGGCACGAIRITSAGEPQAKTLCHCRDCRKTTGSLFSTNILMPGDGFSLVKGKPKEFVTTANSGKSVTSFFCGDCGSTIWREGAAFGDSKVVKAGTLDTPGAVEVDAKPAVEVFASRRIPWLPSMEGTELIPEL